MLSGEPYIFLVLVVAGYFWALFTRALQENKMFEPVDSPYARYLVVAGEQTLEVWAYRHELRLGHEGQPVVTFYDSMGWKVLITAYDYIHCLGTPKQNEEQAKENAQ